MNNMELPENEQKIENMNYNNQNLQNNINSTNQINNQNLQNNINLTNQTNNKNNTKTIKSVLLGVILILLGVIITIILLYTPKNIFNKCIDNYTKIISKKIKESNINNTLYDLTANFNTNIEGYEELSKYTYGIKGGIDSKNKSIETKIYMLNENNKEYSISGYLKNSKIYSLLSSYDKLIYINEINENEFKTLFDNMNKINENDEKYLLEKISELLKKNLNKNNFSSKLTTININKKNIIVKKNTYKLNKNEAERIIKEIATGLYNDEKAISIITNITGYTKEKYKKTIDNYKQDYITEPTYINIYTKLGKTIGYDIEKGNDKSLYYYEYKDNFEMMTSEDNNKTYISGIKKDDKLNVTIKENNTQISTLTFNKYTKNKIEFDYNVNIEDVNYNGKVKYKKLKRKNNQTSTLNISMNNNTYNYNLKLKLDKKKNYKIADINTNQAVTLTEEEATKIFEQFINSLNETPIGQIISSFTSENSTSEIDDINNYLAL